MQVRYDEDLVESAVMRCASNTTGTPPALQIARYHRGREKLYSVLDPDERNLSFFKLNFEWFREWGLETRLTVLVDEFPLLAKHLSLLVFRKSRGRADEGAELYVNTGGQRNGVVALNVQLVFESEKLETFVRHELQHLHDMIDPQFGYEPELHLDQTLPQQQRLALERYRLIWDVSIDGRLSLGNKPPLAGREQRWSEFERAFCFWPEPRRREVFQKLWTNRSPTHEHLVRIVSDPRALETAYAPGPGALCPLCGFPTFDWAPKELIGCAEAAIRTEFPSWTLEQGSCGRCAKIYKSRANQKPVIV